MVWQMHWKFTVQVQAQIFVLFTTPLVMLHNPEFISTGLLKKFSVLIFCCVHSPMLLFVLEICSFQYAVVHAHGLEARDLCYRVQFHLSLLRSVIIETQFWIWCHCYDYRWSLVWSVQNMLAKCSIRSYSAFISIATSIPITKRKKTYTELWCL